MAQYRKKPVVIDAMLFTGDNYSDVLLFVGDKATHHKVVGGASSGADHPELYQKLTITTVEGEMLASPGDYIIKGVKGEFYPCKPDIFALTYDAI